METVHFAKRTVPNEKFFKTLTFYIKIAIDNSEIYFIVIYFENNHGSTEHMKNIVLMIRLLLISKNTL